MTLVLIDLPRHRMGTGRHSAHPAEDGGSSFFPSLCWKPCMPRRCVAETMLGISHQRLRNSFYHAPLPSFPSSNRCMDPSNTISAPEKSEACKRARCAHSCPIHEPRCSIIKQRRDIQGEEYATRMDDRQCARKRSGSKQLVATAYVPLPSFNPFYLFSHCSCPLRPLRSS